MIETPRVTYAESHSALAMPIFYDCQRCTACCRWPGQVRLDEATILSIATYLGLTESAFIQRYTRLRADRRGLALLDQPDGACIFLEDSNCRIQAVKPQQCRDFPNRWNFPGFQELCHALPRVVDDVEYRRLVTQATGLPPETAA